MLLNEALEKKISFEFKQIEKELSVIDMILKAKNNKLLDEIELRAAASSIHSIYNGIEKIIIQIFKDQNIEFTATSKSHSELLKKAFERSIISLNLERKLREYMGFRHFYRHAYGFMIDNELIYPLLENINDLVVDFKNEIVK
ncbi:MAG: hypothetical protein SVR08_16785 [Spirochaetota bacterium]|nr:hypothetical protein [Spirochaetota bacterium]